MKDINLNNLQQSNKANVTPQKGSDSTKLPANYSSADGAKNADKSSTPRSKLDQFEKILAKTLNEGDNDELSAKRRSRFKSRRRRAGDRGSAETTNLDQTEASDDIVARIDPVDEREASLQQQQDKFINTVKPMKKEAQISSYVINKQFADLTNILHKHGVKDKFEDPGISINHKVMRLMST